MACDNNGVIYFYGHSKMKKKTPTKQTDDTIEKAYRVQLQQKRETNQLDGNVKKDWTTDERDG